MRLPQCIYRFLRRLFAGERMKKLGRILRPFHHLEKVIMDAIEQLKADVGTAVQAAKDAQASSAAANAKSDTLITLANAIKDKLDTASTSGGLSQEDAAALSLQLQEGIAASQAIKSDSDEQAQQDADAIGRDTTGEAAAAAG